MAARRPRPDRRVPRPGPRSGPSPSRRGSGEPGGGLFGPDPAADTWDAAGSADDDVEALDALDAGGPAADPRRPDEVLTVPQVAARIRALLERGFPEAFWLVGEVSGLKRHGGGHWFLDLVDADPDDPSKRAKLSAKMWRSNVSKLFGPRGRLAGVLDPQDGLKLKVLVRPDFYAPHGSISFIIQDVDADATLGDLDRQRREALARLERDGALEWNKAVPLPEVPLVIGLITARDSAAENDFLQTLAASGLGFHVLRCDARMQGTGTSASVRGALATLAAGVPAGGPVRRRGGRPGARGGARDEALLVPDVIVVVRGGGSRIDLSWFDHEDVARAVASCTRPVLTGIGHEIDTSVTDLAAHRAFKTPTAVAEFLAGVARDAGRAAEEAWGAIVATAGLALREHDTALADTARRTRSAVNVAIADAGAALVHTGQRIRSGAERLLLDQGHELRAAGVRLTTGRHLAALPRHAERLLADTRRLALGGRARLAAAEQSLAAAESRCRLLDPTAVLRRGYSLLRRTDGRLVLDAADVRPGDPLTARLRDGELDLTADARRLDGPDPA